MKATSGSVYDSIRQNHLVTVLPILTAEWNYNRYSNPTADNTPSEFSAGYDVDLFPISSIVKPVRPTKGIVKAVTGQATVSPAYRDAIPTNRYYVADAKDVYKYWQSPQPASGSGAFNFPNHTDSITVVRPRVEYHTDAGANTTVSANKIIATFETTFASPDDFDVQIKTTTGGAWTTIATNPVIASDGRATLYYTGSGWTSTQTFGFATNIYAIQLVVRSMDTAGAYLNLIELGARLEMDLSSDLSHADDTQNLGDVDFITPMGTISSNTGSVTLFNDDGKYTNSNASSPLYGLLDKNVKMRLKYRYGATDIQEFEMFTDTWTENFDETEVSLTDQSTYLQETKPPQLFYTNISVQEVIWRILDSIGFTKYKVTSLSTSANTMIDVFWTNGDQTVWEVFQELSKGTQTAVYFDSDGYLNVRTRDAAFNNAATPAWTMRGTPSGVELTDIVSVESDTQYEANKATVTYQPTGFSAPQYNIIPYEIVWEPNSDTTNTANTSDGDPATDDSTNAASSETVSLRASQLVRSLLVADNPQVAWLSQTNASIWPWKGMMQVEGEWIAYEGKGYYYYDNGGVRRTSVVKSFAEQQKLDAQAPALLQHLNKYDGSLMVTERGKWNTTAADHTIGINSTWFKEQVLNYGTHTLNPSGFTQAPGSSTISVEGDSGRTNKFYKYLHRGNNIDSGWNHVGTRMQINKSGTAQQAGIFINGDAGSVGGGYYIDIMATNKMTGTQRKLRNEVLIYSMLPNGSKKNFGGAQGYVKDKSVNHGRKTKIDKGAATAILLDTWFNVDVHFRISGGNHYIKVDINGKNVLNTNIPSGSSWQHNWVSRSGMFATGYSKATFEYWYSTAIDDVRYDDQTNFYDAYTKGYVGDAWFRDWVYNTRDIQVKTKAGSQTVQQKYAQRFFDEFGPYAHEVREFDVKFDIDKPVLQSKLFNTNELAICTEYNGTPFGAYFILANAARVNVIANGDDELTYGADNPVTQTLLVYGRPVIQKDAVQIVKTDDWAVRRRGTIDIEYSSKWIQNESAANNFANWLTTNWTRSDSTITAEVFGNPLVELCDVVAASYQNLAPSTHKYFVTGTTNSFEDGGMTTNWTLRRVSI